MHAGRWSILIRSKPKLNSGSYKFVTTCVILRLGGELIVNLCLYSSLFSH
jgi:hypothetical protein